MEAISLTAIVAIVAIVALCSRPPAEARRAPGGARGQGEGPRALSATADLAAALADMFSIEELQSLFLGLQEGRHLVQALPGGEVSPQMMALQAALLLERMGMLDKAFFARWTELRPRRAEEIARLKGRILGS